MQSLIQGYYYLVAEELVQESLPVISSDRLVLEFLNVGLQERLKHS